MKPAGMSLLTKILLSTSIVLTGLFVATALIVQNHVGAAAAEAVDEEIRASFRAYESAWTARASALKSSSALLATMSDVRAAFGTGDGPTIRDTAGELWSRIAEGGGVFIVTDPQGKVIAAPAAIPGIAPGGDFPEVRGAARQFPSQVSGFLIRESRLFRVVVTPVYVDSGAARGLIDVLVAGFAVDSAVAQQLKEASGGSEFAFTANDQMVAGTVGREVIDNQRRGYRSVRSPLADVEGKPLGELWILRSLAGAQARIAELRRDVFFIWLAGILAGLALTYVLARRIVGPVKELDRAAGAVALQNYEHRVPVKTNDELGRLASTFNIMCDSLQRARGELIRQERIATIGRLATSIVHDLRNPLAAIYGGAEMLVDTKLSDIQVRRLAGNIYKASRRIQELLQDLANVARGRKQGSEICSLREIVTAARDAVASSADSQAVAIQLEVGESIELPMERARMERVFVNLFANALEVMPEGGKIIVKARNESGNLRVEVADTGPGILPEVRDRLFEPFSSAGKKNGLGLGLALSRQTLIDHGGDMWHEPADAGARFVLRLPWRN